MPCDTRLKKGQSISERKAEIKAMVDKLVRGLTSGSIKPVVGPQGAVAFQGLTEADRDGVTDACAYRRLLATGSASAIMAIQRAEMLAGRKVNSQQVGIGAHAHFDANGGIIWHAHKG